ncbi:hypothetical protein CONPUDRAFT_119943 [Coniophora puteana RWD-64-598 SS2]|uniref:Vacuolar protein sorting-associated protein 51 homolog n=1 Tax=Coniophora puteana (strain RWD-64-598) TaxID=741705 RepID=A0A5M3N023_CONPW|nr:uncharacterized protein CONPUDRAFT_119943 [Coniophora puteana RWD-64-598 SS2]EIW84241.1 hypothetical protein CONPUDRAFT_119943 [Coniophora puteana RWD-64-598 SS2]
MSSSPQSPPTSPSGQRQPIPRIPLSPSPLHPPSPRQTNSNPSTPASRRTSLPVGSTSPPPTSKSRARDLLRKHYGLGIGPPQPLPGKVNDPMDLDSAAFDAKSYYEQLITTSNLPTLLKKENELMSEIKQLDGERQALVYNHHHELIAASDTIAAMKTRAESLDADLDLLRAAFSEISRLGSEIVREN